MHQQASPLGSEVSIVTCSSSKSNKDSAIATLNGKMNLKIVPLWCWMTLAAIIMLQELPTTAASTDQCTNRQQSTLAFLPGTHSSCQTIYDNYPKNRDISGYYWVTNYCGMSYSGPSCKDILADNPELRDKPGFYQVKGQWYFAT